MILCTGGMTKMFQRTTASNNLAGEGVGLALRAGARVIDIEFLQFYPNGHLAPRMVGLDPTTWEPTRVKLGGRLLDGNGEEFLHRYGEADGGSYDTARDILTYAIYKEVQAGRGTPHGGVYLSFQHVDEQKLKDALGPVTEIFARNNIDLTRQPVEIFPIAHYQMGGVEVDADMASSVPGLYAAGELAGGANGANRLSGNALPEAVVFGERAGEKAAQFAARNKTAKWDDKAAQPHLDLIRKVSGRNAGNGMSPGQLMGELKKLMWEKVGAFRNANDLEEARGRVHAMRRHDLDDLTISAQPTYNTSLVEWFELAQRAAGGGSRRDRGTRPAGEPGSPPARRFSQGGRPLPRQSAAIASRRGACFGVRKDSRVIASSLDSAGSVKTARLRIWRGADRDHGHYDEFNVAFEDGDSVLDGLVRIRLDTDPDLAVRFSCFNANVCKECTMLIDGEVEYACIAKLRSGLIQLDPLPNVPLIRDLVTDTLSRKERF